MYGDAKNLEEVKKKLNSVSPSFCMAKWMHTTIHLLNGTTHSCYLPPVHPIPLKEITQNPSALHNTKYKKEQRKKMLTGERPKECSMCWAIEDLPQEHVSDRILRGNETWTAPYIDKVKNLPWDANVLPTYVEVSFSSVCNFKCSYCSPHVSTKWHEEIKQHGPYKLSEHKHQDTKGLASAGLMPIEDEDNNPYIDAFWKWWPELYQNLKVFRITGGEPLLSKHTERVLDWLDEKPNPNLELDINSNLGVPQAIFERFMLKIENLVNNKKIRAFSLHTSLDTYGAQAEYIRHGLKFEQYNKNVRNYLERIPKGRIAFMCTFNALSIPNFKNFLDWILDLRVQYQNSNRAVHLDIPHLTGPHYQSVRVLPAEYQDQIRELMSYMKLNLTETYEQPGFRAMEIEKLARILDWMQVPQSEKDLKQWRKDFYLFFREHDRRRSTDFLKTFPEMKGFWKNCMELCQKPSENYFNL